MSKKIIKIFTIFLFFTVCLPFYSQNASKIENASLTSDDDYSNLRLLDQKTVYYSYLVDSNMEYSQEYLPKDKLIEVNGPFNPGFYDGVIWIDIYFPSYKKYDYTVYLGSEPLEFAELYIETENGWEFAGRTGQHIPKSSMTEINWFHTISFNEANFPVDTASYHARIKLLSHTASTNIVRIFNQRAFNVNAYVINYVNWLLLSFYIICIFFFIFVGIHFGDSVYIHMVFCVLSQIMFLLELKGIGPVFLWNKIALKPYSYRMIFVWAEVSILYLVLIFLQVLKENNEKPVVMKTIIFTFSALFLEFVITAFFKNPKNIYSSFIGNILGTIIIFTVMLIIYTVNKNHTMRTLFYFWIPAGLLIFSRTILHILRLYYFIPIFTFSDNDFYFVYDIAFILIAIPFIIFSSRRLRDKYIQARMALYSEEKTNRYLISEISFFSKVNREVLNLSNIIINTLHLPQSPDPNYNRENQALIEKTSTNIADIISAVSLMDNKQAITPSCINLQSFIYNNYKIVEKEARDKGINISLTMTIPTDVIVYENPRLMELIFLKLMMLSVKCSPFNSKLKMEAKLENSQLFMSIKNKDFIIPSDDFIVKDSELSSLLDYELIERGLKQFNGKITKDMSIRGMKFNINMNLHMANIESELIISNPLFNTALSGTSGVKSDIAIKDNLLLVDGKMPNILVIEDDTNAMTLLKQILKSHCHLTTASTGAEAWNYLNMDISVLPDIIVTEYNLPIMNGMEFYRKCMESENFRNIPFMFILNDSEKNKRNDLIRKGISCCITKPFDKDYFITCLLSMLTLCSKAQSKILTQITSAVSGRQNTVPPKQIHVNYPSVDAQKNTTQQITLSTSEATTFAAYDLSKREQQIAILILEGKSDKEIASSLNISPATVATHNKKLFKKLEVHSRIELMNKLR